ncbi:YrvL family regulatory protein [Terrisporobacter othiniensis]|uniref:YrvL family regulatory protein n=1 Tax=Terrisporobacter othiniensis TaxID=1577792 RepID=UPI002418A592|nr:YrvL family regulatory protein [Terrisporobacter othiniensis]
MLSFIIYMVTMLVFEAIIYTVVGIGFLSFLGFTYDSYISVIIFLIICYVMLIPADYYTSILIGLFKIKSNISRFQQRAIDFILYTSFSSLVVGIVDFFMEGISISPANQILFVLLYYLLDMYSDMLLLSKI